MTASRRAVRPDGGDAAQDRHQVLQVSAAHRTRQDQARRGKAISALQRVAGGDITAYDGLDLTKADQWEEDHCNR